MRAPRLFLEDKLTEGSQITLTQDRAHYLRNVLRLRPGDGVRLFNPEDGEWQAQIEGIERRDVLLKLQTLVRPAREEAGPRLFFAPLKRHRMEMLLEKSVELGVQRLSPVITSHTVVDRLNPNRMRSRLIEAAEQCERLTLPQVDDAIELEALPSDIDILMADEHGGGVPLLQGFDLLPDAAVLIGPEGGFSLEERDALCSRSNIKTVTLGETILRAETAAIFVLSVWRAWNDDEVVEE